MVYPASLWSEFCHIAKICMTVFISLQKTLTKYFAILNLYACFVQNHFVDDWIENIRCLTWNVDIKYHDYDDISFMSKE